MTLKQVAGEIYKTCGGMPVGKSMSFELNPPLDAISHGIFSLEIGELDHNQVPNSCLSIQFNGAEVLISRIAKP